MVLKFQNYSVVSKNSLLCMYNLDIHQLILTVVGKHYYRTFGYRLCKVSCLAVLNVHTLHKNTQYINVSFLGETVGWYEDTGWMTLKVSCQGCFFQLLPGNSSSNFYGITRMSSNFYHAMLCIVWTMLSQDVCPSVTRQY